MKIESLQTDEAILAELGARIARRRLELEWSQAQVAEQAGVAKRTVERIEAGASAQMSSLIRVFRALELIPALEQLLPDTGPRPMEHLESRRSARRRAPARRRQTRAP
jgi:transcriptional regulator with XRE-family HTH domain